MVDGERQRHSSNVAMCSDIRPASARKGGLARRRSAAATGRHHQLLVRGWHDHPAPRPPTVEGGTGHVTIGWRAQHALQALSGADQLSPPGSICSSGDFFVGGVFPPSRRACTEYSVRPLCKKIPDQPRKPTQWMRCPALRTEFQKPIRYGRFPVPPGEKLESTVCTASSGEPPTCACAQARVCGLSVIVRYIRYISVYFSLIC